MNLKEIIAASNKTNISVGPWTDEKPRKKDFPLSRKSGGAFPLTRKWRWATVEFEIGSAKFRLLVAYHIDVPEYMALLGEQISGDSCVLARLEYHANHPHLGWHLHANCE